MQLYTTDYNEALLAKWRDNVNEETINGYLSEYTNMFQNVFKNKSQLEHFKTYLRGLMSNLDRKSIEPIALAFEGDKGVRPLQQFFKRSSFDDEILLECYQNVLSACCSSKNAMLSVDGTDFVKKGSFSPGVGRQYCGRIGKTENCQSMVFCAYAGNNGYGLVDRELYVPKEWFDKEHSEYREKCDFAENKVFLTKNELALSLIRKALQADILPVRWIGCDAAFGCDHDFLDALPETVWYFAAVRSTELVFTQKPEMLLPEQPPAGRRYIHEIPSVAPVKVASIATDDGIPWQRLKLFRGSKGDVWAEVKCLRCISCRTETKFGNYVLPHKGVWLYIRRYENQEIKYFLSNAPEAIEMELLHEAATLRWPIEQCFEECKSYLGMSHFEGRSYKGLLRHTLFVMIAHLFTTSIRVALKKTVYQ